VNTWKVILATVVIFSAGVFTGGLLVKQTSKPEPLPSPQFGRIEMLRRLSRLLSLTPEQNEQLDTIMRESQERTKVFWELLEPELRGEFRKTRDEIREVLTPEQRKQFDDQLKQRQRRPGLMSSTNAPRRWLGNPPPAARPSAPETQ
jgi:Spy/CpxP family protein refolding chaperone